MGQQGLRRPAAEINGECDAVAGKCAQHNGICAAGMARKNGNHILGEKNGAAPAVGEADIFKHRMQSVDAVFERGHTFRGFAARDIEYRQFAPVLSVNQSAAEN